MNKLNPNNHIEKVLGDGIEWYHYEKLEGTAHLNYLNDAKLILSNETFNNELNHYINVLMEALIYDSGDFDQVTSLRASILALQTFRDRLTRITDPRKEQSADNIHEAI